MAGKKTYSKTNTSPFALRSEWRVIKRDDKRITHMCDSSGIINSCSGCGRPYNAYPTAKMNKVKDLALIYFYQYLYPHQDFICCQKHLEQAFFYVILFTRIHLMICLSSMVNLIAVTHFYWHPVYIAVSKEYFRRIQIIFMLLESTFH